MLSSIIAFCVVGAPVPGALQGYQPIVKSGNVQSSPVGGDGQATGTQQRAVWYTNSTARIEVRLSGTGADSFPLELTLKFEKPTPIVGIRAEDVTKKVVFKDAGEVVKVDYATTANKDTLNLSVFQDKTKVATLLVDIVQGIGGASR